MDKTDSEIREALQQLTGIQFEQFIADLWELQGYDTELTKATSDGGVDVVATDRDTNDRIVIQAKRRNSGNSVGVREIRDFLGSSDRADEYVFVTTSQFTTDAKARAFETARDISLLDGQDIVEVIRQTQSEPLLREYIEAGDSIPSQRQLDTFTDDSSDHSSDAGATEDVATGSDESDQAESSDTAIDGDATGGNWLKKILISITGAIVLVVGSTQLPSQQSVQGILALSIMILGYIYPAYGIYRDGRARDYGILGSLLWPMASLVFPVIVPLGYIYLGRRYGI